MDGCAALWTSEGVVSVWVQVPVALSAGVVLPAIERGTVVLKPPDGRVRAIERYVEEGAELAWRR